jgi:hypothetical protein
MRWQYVLALFFCVKQVFKNKINCKSYIVVHLPTAAGYAGAVFFVAHAQHMRYKKYRSP